MSAENPYGSSPGDDNPFAPPQIQTGPASVAPIAKSLAGLQKTRLGLQLYYYGIVLILVAFLLLIIGVFVGLLFSGPGARDGIVLAVIGAILLYGMMLVGGIMMFVGQCFCLTVPNESGAKGLITTVVIIQVISFCVTGLLIGLSAAQVGGEAGELIVGVVNLVNGILGIVGFFCFLNFIKQVNTYITRHDLAQDTKSLISLFMFIILGYFAMFAIFLLLAVAGGAAMGGFMLAIGGLVILVMGIVALVKFTTLLRNSAEALRPRQY